MARIVPRVAPALPQDHGGSRSAAVDTIVIHTTQGGDSLDAVAQWWDREDVVASAHYILNGKSVLQRVDEELVAYHCGNRYVHQRSIGIEVTGDAGRPETWTPEKLSQLADLIADVLERHPGIPIVHAMPGLIGHAEVPCPGHKGKACAKLGGASHHWDPGPHLDWAALLDEVRARVAPPLAPAPVPEPQLVR